MEQEIGKTSHTTPGWALALLGTGCMGVLAILVWMACYAQPVKDDFLSAVLFRNKTPAQSLLLQYREHNGRLASALLMRYAPLQYGSFLGYKLVCIVFILLFALSLLLLFWHGLRTKLHVADRFVLFAVGFICLQAALGQLSEFYYWLPAISCYGIAILMFLLLLAVLPRALSAGNLSYFVVAFGCCALLPLYSEAGVLMAVSALVCNAYVANKERRLSMMRMATLILLIVAAAALAAGSPGNAARLAATPYTRSVLTTTVTGLAAAGFTSLKMVYYLGPVALVAWLMVKGSVIVIDRTLAIRLLAITSVLWLGAFLLASHAMGGWPPLRLQNCLLVALSITLGWIGNQAIAIKTPIDASASRWRTTAIGIVSVWCCSSLTMPWHPVCKAGMELVSGLPQAYDADMKEVYREAAGHPGTSVCHVLAVQVIPSTLFIDQPLVTGTDGWPYFHVQMARYFGHDYLVADTLAQVPDATASFQRKLASIRRKK